MIQDCFEVWYYNTYDDLDINLDEMSFQLHKAYRAGWMKCLSIDDGLKELQRLSEGDYND